MGVGVLPQSTQYTNSGAGQMVDGIFTISEVEGDGQGGPSFATRSSTTPASATAGVRGFSRSRGAAAFHNAPVVAAKGQPLFGPSTGAMTPRKPDAVDESPASGFEPPATWSCVLPLTPAGLPSRRGFTNNPARSRSHLARGHAVKDTDEGTLADLGKQDWRMMVDGDTVTICRPDATRSGAWVGPLLGEMIFDTTFQDDDGDGDEVVIALDSPEGRNLIAATALPQFAYLVVWAMEQLQSSSMDTSKFHRQLQARCEWLRALVDGRTACMGEGVHGLQRFEDFKIPQEQAPSPFTDAPRPA